MSAWAKVRNFKGTGKDAFYLAILILTQWASLFRIERAKSSGVMGAVQESARSLLGALIVGIAAWVAVAIVVILGWAIVAEARRWHRE